MGSLTDRSAAPPNGTMFGILGPLEARLGGRAVPLGGRKQRGLLAVLLLNANEVVSQDRLIDALWGERPPETAATALHGYVSQLRKRLGAAGEPLIVTREPGYVLQLDRDQLDLGRFEDLVAEARTARRDGDDERAADLLREALGLWRGPPLTDLAAEPFAQSDIARLDELRVSALEDRLDTDLALGRHREVVPELERLVRTHPLRERLHAQLMLALYRCGRQGDALAAYRDARRVLVEELGLEPGPALQELERAILHHSRELDLAPRPKTRPRSPRVRAAAVAGASAALFAAIISAVAVMRGSEDGPLAGVDANSVAVIDPATGEIVDQLGVGATPTSIAVGEGAVWVLNADDQTISRIDPDSRTVKTFGTGGTPTDLAAGAGAVWIGNRERLTRTEAQSLSATSVARLDPATSTLRTTIHLPLSTSDISNLTDDHIAVGRGAVWVINPNFTVSRIDPRTNAVVAVVENVNAGSIAADGDAVWVLNTDRTVARIDPRTNRAGEPIEVAATSLTDIAVGAGSVWLADPYDGVVWRIKRDPTLVMRTIPAQAGANRVAFAEGSVWVVNSLRGTVSRIDPSANRLARTIALGNTPRSLAVGAGAVWVAVAGTGGGNVPAAASTGDARADALPQTFCSDVFYSGEGRPDYLIVSDLPLQGGPRFATVQMSEAIAFVLRERRFRAGRFRIGYQSCDDSTAKTGIFDPAKCAANAKAYAAAVRVLGMIGPFNSGCAFEQIPIANRATLPIVSPTNSIVDLTRAVATTPREHIATLYPTGRRNYVRVIATEADQAAANVVLARNLGLRRIYILYDGDETFHEPLAVGFRKGARPAGLRVVGFRVWDPRAKSYAGLAAAVARSGADGVFLAGSVYANGGKVIGALRRALGRDVELIGTESFLPVAPLVELSNGAAVGMYVSKIGLTVERLPPAGAEFVEAFGATQPGGTIDVSSAYAAQAADVLLDAIARSDGTRASVVRQLFAARIEDGIVGSFRFDRNGDVTSPAITILRVRRGGGADVIGGVEGATVDRVIVPPRSLVD